MDTHIIKEGLIEIQVPDFEKVSSEAPVFYNPVMELNRDISVVVINQYRKSLDHDITICDAFGGTGIRGARYSKEIPGVKRGRYGSFQKLGVGEHLTDEKIARLQETSLCTNWPKDIFGHARFGCLIRIRNHTLILCVCLCRTQEIMLIKL